MGTCATTTSQKKKVLEQNYVVKSPSRFIYTGSLEQALTITTTPQSTVQKTPESTSKTLVHTPESYVKALQLTPESRTKNILSIPLLKIKSLPNPKINRHSPKAYTPTTQYLNVPHSASSKKWTEPRPTDFVTENFRIVLPEKIESPIQLLSERRHLRALQLAKEELQNNSPRIIIS